MTRRLSLAVLFLAAVGCAAADDKKAASEALKPFQGKWKIVRAEENGKEERGSKTKAQFIFDGDRLTVAYPWIESDAKGQRKVENKAVYTVDPSKKPAEIDIRPDKAGDPKQRVTPGIYKFEDSKLTLCFSQGGKHPRPKDFSSQGAESYTLMVLERVADKD